MLRTDRFVASLSTQGRYTLRRTARRGDARPKSQVGLILAFPEGRNPDLRAGGGKAVTEQSLKGSKNGRRRP